MGNHFNFSFLHDKFLNNEIQNYLLFIVLFAAILFAIGIFKRLVQAKLERWFQNTLNSHHNFLTKIITHKAMPFIYLLAFQLSLQSLTFSPRFAKNLNIIMVILLTVTGTRVIQVITISGLSLYWNRKQDESANNHVYQLMLTITKITIWVLSAVIMLQNLPIDITPLLTGLGIGGIAIAFAAQAILQDLFSFVTIFLDRPFEIGDFIVIDQFMGTVDKIGIKTTRLCSLSGEQLIISNRDLTNSRLRNYKRMDQRRVAFNLDVTYETDMSMLREIPQILKEIIQSTGLTNFDRAHFASFGPSSLVYEVVYYVVSNNYTVYMDVQQEINFKIKEAFLNRGIDFAYPTQVLYVGSMSEQ